MTEQLELTLFGRILAVAAVKKVGVYSFVAILSKTRADHGLWTMAARVPKLLLNPFPR